MTVAEVEQQAQEIADAYYPKLAPLEDELKRLGTWLGSKPASVRVPRKQKRKAMTGFASTKEAMGRLLIERNGRILALYEENRMVAPSLEKLGELRGGHFKKPSWSSGVTTTQEASSERLGEGAYHCRRCGLWVVGSPRSGTLPGQILGSSDYYFCRICGHLVGELSPGARRMLDRQYMP